MRSVKKTQFAGLNDKHFYFHDGIVSLPLGQFLLNKVREETEKHPPSQNFLIKIEESLSYFFSSAMSKKGQLFI